MVASRFASFLVLCTLAAGSLAGCAAEADEAAAPAGDVESEDDLTAAALVGRYTFDNGAGRPPMFRSLELRADKSFYADIDTGIRCVRAPCPSGAQLWGTYTAGTKFLTLRAGQGAEASDFYGRYAVKRTPAGLELARAQWDGWANTLKKSPGIWAENATKLTAQSSGGGFAPPPPPGSSCARGAQKYTLDIASRELSYERCEASAAGPFAKKTGTKTLSAKDARSIVDVARAASIVTDRDICGADKPMVSVSLVTPSGTKRYLDSFYACRKGSTPYADGLDAILHAMADATE